ncbi:streptomycin 6-kinase [Tropicimonas sediminicola]|uniref:Streptomycin 6-kinase n=1 Tax=Tropicimonas sediminicola TaxID=1031541 RepID=A0A239M6E5_9RHOB|nr:streptomycin 6-kinase [Tropicimonas sediminicola]
MLKVLTDRGAKVGDMIGAEILSLWDGNGAVKLIDRTGNAMLLEWLPGPSLREKAPCGQDQMAAKVISELSLKLRLSKADGFIELKDHFGGALPKAEISGFPEPYRDAFGRAQTMWQALLRTTEEMCLMHGDLNHDNILWSDRGWVVIDPKGVVADPCYEFSVVFRGPVGEEARAAKPERILELAELLARGANLDRTRILQFGFVHVAMSLAYHFTRGSISETDMAIFQAFDSLQLPVPG